MTKTEPRERRPVLKCRALSRILLWGASPAVGIAPDHPALIPRDSWHNKIHLGSFSCCVFMFGEQGNPFCAQQEPSASPCPGRGGNAEQSVCLIIPDLLTDYQVHIFAKWNSSSVSIGQRSFDLDVPWLGVLTEPRLLLCNQDHFPERFQGLIGLVNPGGLATTLQQNINL